MKSNRKMTKINSKYVLNSLFNYINDDKFKMKLFLYSKALQKLFDINIFDYQLHFLNKNGMKYNNYYKFDYNSKNNKNENFDKDIIKKTFTKDLSKYNINITTNIISKILNYLENEEKNKNNIDNKDDNDDKINENKINVGIEIDIYSPFFDSLSINNKIYEKFSIIIPTKYFKGHNLINDYISIFEKLNKLKIKYESITLLCNDNNDLNDLLNLNIKFEQIKKLSIIIMGKQINYNNFFNILFSLNIHNNLLYLSLKSNYYSKINAEEFININNFKSLEHLSLIKFYFKNVFILKLSNLKTICIEKCEKITLDENTCLNLKKLFIYDSNRFFFGIPNILLKFPNIDECELIDRHSEISHYDNIIDFASFKNLRCLKVEDSDFFHLYNAPIEQLSVYTHSFSKRSINLNFEISDIKVIRKILSLENLKKVFFNLNIINRESILKIQDKNNSITNMTINCNFHRVGDFMIYFLKLFPNLEKLAIIMKSISYYNDKEYKLEIIENSNYKIDEIKVIMAGTDIILNCGLYKNLKKINIECKDKIKDIKNILPVFNNKCEVVFNNLYFFRFIYHGSDGINSDILNNIYNNINKMPKLKYFELISEIKNDVEDNFNKLEEQLRKLNLETLYLMKKNQIK